MPPQLHESIEDAEAFIGYLLATTESDKLELARELHDGIGGLMVAAAMDLIVAREKLPATNGDVQSGFDRVSRTLEAAIDKSRRVLEALRPTLLDNVGLFAALKWQLKQASLNSGAACTETYPDIEPSFAPTTSTALFRVAEEALVMMFKRRRITSAALDVRVQDGLISIKFSDDGIPLMLNGMETGAAISLVTMRHRFRSLGGQIDLARTAGGGTVLTASMPLRA